MDYKARFYSPYLNHFTQPDTIIPDLNNPQALNRYSYALNNPLRYNDPTGHWPEWVDNIISAVDLAAGWAAEEFLPSTAPGSHFNVSININMGGPLIHQQVDFVTDSRGEVQLFHTTYIKDWIDPANKFTRKINPTIPIPVPGPGEIPLSASPSASVTMSGGQLFGKKLLKERTDAFAGTSVQNGGSVGLLAIEEYVSFDRKLLKQNKEDLYGFDSGITYGFPFGSMNRYAVESEPLDRFVKRVISRPIPSTKKQLSGIGLFACRIIGMCGR